MMRPLSERTSCNDFAPEPPGSPPESPSEAPEHAARASAARRETRSASGRASSVSLVISRLRNGSRSALTGFVQRLLDLCLQVLVVANWAYHLPVEEEGRRGLDAGLSSIALVGQDGDLVAPGVQAGGKCLGVQRQLAGVPFELVGQERADAFSLP